MVDTFQFYVTDFGNVVLPWDFPSGVYRKNGLPDMRRKIGPALVRYFEDLNEAARREYVSGKWPGDLKTISWEEWLAKS